jgi:Predicted membrane protein
MSLLLYNDRNGGKSMSIVKIWSDKKRVLGLPISFTTYSLSEDRLFIDSGFLKKQSEEILLYRVRDLSYSQTLGQRLLDLGTVTIQSSDKTTPVVQIINIKKAFDVKELIHENVEKMKLERRMRVGEILEDGHDYADDIDD